MAFSHGRTAQLFIDDDAGTEREFTAYLTDVGLDLSADLAETTALSNTAKAFIAGIKDRKFKISGHYDPTAENYLNGVYNVATQFKFFPAGSATGRTYYDGTALCNDLSISSDISKANAIEAGFQVTSNPTFGTV